MLAYRKSDFDVLAARAAVDEWSREGAVDAELAASLNAKFPIPFYSPNLFIRIGLFLFGSLCAMASLGLLVLMTKGFDTGRGYGVLFLAFAAGLIAAAEALIRKAKPYFRAGLEEAFLYGALLSLAFGLYGVFRIRGDLHWPMAVFMGAMAAAAAMRYADSLLAAASLGLFGFALFDACSGSGGRAAYVLPCAVMSFSALAAFASGRALAAESLRYWDHLWSLVRLLSLLAAYAGGNYFVVREVGHAFFHHSVTVERDIPLAPLFYLITFGLPAAYLVAGLVKKDRLFLNAGLITAALAVLTYKYYHHVMPVEAGLALAGVFLIAVAWSALRLLRKPRYGLTTARTDQAAGDAGKGLMDAESLAMLHGFATKDAPQQTPEGLKGGGGGFGGGGASGKF